MYIDNMVEETLQNPCNKIAVFEADKVLVMKIFWWAKLSHSKAGLVDHGKGYNHNKFIQG